MPRRDIVVIGGSAGGLDALKTIAAMLPRDLAASVFVVLHTAPEAPGLLAEILDRAGPIPAANARDGERVRPGRIYVAPPDRHLVLEPNLVRLTRGPRENRFRPAVDPLFRSAAAVYGPRAVGVILTGGLDDGAAGLWAVKRLGGVAVVQDPREAPSPSMPESAMRNVEVDHCVPVAEIAPLLVRLTSAEAEEKGASAVPKRIEIENRIAGEQNPIEAGVLELGPPSAYSCPECHGVLLQVKDALPLRFRCHTGHAYSLESLLAEVEQGVEDALWNAIRAVAESALLMRHLAGHLRDAGGGTAAEDLLARAAEAERRSEIARQIVLSPEGPSLEAD